MRRDSTSEAILSFGPSQDIEMLHKLRVQSEPQNELGAELEDGTGKGRRMYFMRVTTLGAPRVDKGTRARRIAEKYHIPHISMGDISQANIKGGTELGMKAKGFMDRGMPTPDEITIGVLMNRIRDADYVNGYVLDDFPRTIPQAESLTGAPSTQRESIDSAVNVDVPNDNVVSRMVGCRICPAHGATYHIGFNPSKKGGICDMYGQELVLRDDGKPEIVQKRLDVYHEQTQPLVEYYKQVGTSTEMDGTQNIDDVFSNIVDILGA